VLGAARRKASHLAHDPVLRRWLVMRAGGRAKPASDIRRAWPPYLEHVPLPAATHHASAADFPPLATAQLRTPLTLALPGEQVRLAPDEADALFSRRYADLETLLAVHRFAWLPLARDSVEPAWVEALWAAWLRRHRAPDDDWAWHPYTAAERAINLLDYARRTGLPGRREETLECLAVHAEAIARRLEYFGEGNTSNHLSNNGRGLFLIGLALGMRRYADLGGRILLAEAERIFRPSGILREDSSHYHLLLARNYACAWLAARAHGRAEAEALESVTRRALAVLPHLAMPGGFPLVGDISPDCPPTFLFGLLPKSDMNVGWCGSLEGEDRTALRRVRDEMAPVASDKLSGDGWHRFDDGSWACLWHATPDGWSAMPGHGHQDLGGFEVHFRDLRLFIDLGRGTYAANGGVDASAFAHNTIVIDGHDPYPPNRPYYGDEFRRAVVGAPPRVVRHADGLELTHYGYTRLRGVGSVTRRWAFDRNSMRITDRVDGSGRRRITRLLHTTLDVEPTHDGIVLGGGGFRIAASGDLAIERSTAWTAYGAGTPATTIRITDDAKLPMSRTLAVTAG
jgi:hypothetical protein